MSEVRLYRPNQLDRDEWRQLQGIARDAFMSTLVRDQAEVDALVEWDNRALFAISHINPNTDVGRQYDPNREYSSPRVAVATEGHELIGFAYSARKVFGESRRDRLVNRLSIFRNYLWIREIAVKPEYQRHGIAKDLGRTLLKDGVILQPVDAYVWPDEDAGLMQDTLEGLGFLPTDKQQVKVFGEDSVPIRQVRMRASSVWSVLKNLAA